MTFWVIGKQRQWRWRLTWRGGGACSSVLGLSREFLEEFLVLHPMTVNPVRFFVFFFVLLTEVFQGADRRSEQTNATR